MKNDNKNILKSTNLRKRAEQRLDNFISGLDEVPTSFSMEIKEIMHELQVHQIELEMQNDELRNAQIIIEEERQKYFDLYNFAPVAYLTFNKEGKILNLNFTAANLLGNNKSFLINTYFYDYIFSNNNDIFYLHLSKVFKTKSKQSCELKLKNKDGTEIYALLDSVYFYDIEGKTENCQTTITDITLQKKTEISMRKYAESQKVLTLEVNHRVRNNLSNIIAMLHMSNDEALEKGLSATQNLMALEGRISGIAVVHSLLSQNIYKPIELSVLSKHIVLKTAQIFSPSTKIDLNVTKSEVLVNHDQAHSLGIILYELTTNSIKYSIPDSRIMKINIIIKQFKNDTQICFYDKGPGYPQEILDRNFSKTGLGFELIIGMITHSLKGEFNLKNDNGAKFVMNFGIISKSDRLDIVQ